MAKYYTLEEDELILNNATKYDTHLRKSFRKSAKKLRRTPEAICTRYYKLINKPVTL
jgi:hypothetical protein